MEKRDAKTDELLKELQEALSKNAELDRLLQECRKSEAELRQCEEQLQEAVRVKEVLVREVHHRVKNNLQVMSSLLRLQTRYTRDEAARQILNDSQSRMQAMAVVHELLFESEDLGTVDRGEYLSRIARHLYESQGVSPERVALHIQAQHVSCTIETAVPLGLIVNELVSNCLEHAFPGERQGEITIATEKIGENEWEVIVSDNGVGLPKDLDPARSGTFGLYLVHALAGQLRGSVELTGTDGLKVRVRFKEAEYRPRRSE
jgi:two-component sensor histidine kinase